MKVPALFLLLLSLHCKGGEGEASVRFSNGDQLSGDMVGLSLDTLSWRSPLLKAPAEFALKKVVDLSLIPAPREPGEQLEGHEATLKLTNGDEIHGKLTGLGDDEIKLSTWYAGELVFRRVIVSSVEISESTDTTYRGPNSLAEWTDEGTDSGWSFKGGALYSSEAGGIAREVNFPKECSIEFDAAWRGAFRGRIYFFTEGTVDIPAKGYDLIFQGSSIQLRKRGSNNLLGQSAAAGQLRENEKAHIEIRASRKTGVIQLFVDGEFLAMWEDEAMDAKELGNGLHLVAQDSSPMKLSNIRVHTWDGYVDDLANQQMAMGGGVFPQGFRDDVRIQNAGGKEEVPEGRMMLRNGDSLEGEVTGIIDDLISIKTPYAEVKFPLTRFKNLALKSENMETPKLMARDVRATLSDGSRLVFSMEDFKEGKIVGFSQNFGTAEFDLSAVKRIEFNIHDRALKKMRARLDDW
ncbi:MAG: hypothetical protein ACSHX7_04510 [Luteolibacter sp.]